MKKLTIAFSMFFALTAAKSQQTNFTGTWKLKEKQAINGPQYGNAMPAQIKVDQGRDSVIMESTYDESMIIRTALSMTGEALVTKNANGQKLVTNVKWVENKKIMIITTTFYLPDNENTVDFKRISSWSLDGNILTIDKTSVETTHESWETKGVFEKQ
jgi:hypothetical protein